MIPKFYGDKPTASLNVTFYVNKDRITLAIARLLLDDETPKPLTQAAVRRELEVAFYCNGTNWDSFTRYYTDKAALMAQADQVARKLYPKFFIEKTETP